MGLSKLSMFFVILTLVIVCKASKKRVTDLSGKSDSVKSDCLCLPKGESGQPVLDFIDADKNNLERLVVYFYVDPQTKKTTAYTPKAQKQQIFPDLSLEVGDNLVPIQSTESIDKIILSPNKIAKNTIANLNPSYNFKIDDGIQNMITNMPNDIAISEMDRFDIPQNVVDNINVVNDIIQTNNKADGPANYKENIKILDNINLETPKKVIQKALPGFKLNTKLQSDSQIPYNVLDGWKTNNIYKWNENVHNIYSNPSLYPGNIQEAGVLKFDQWFQQQKDSQINKLAQNDMKFPDDSVLKSLIYKNLVQNGILMMDNGILKTPEGNILNLANLKLQPLVVGLSLDYNYPVPGVQNKIVPPYFDAMVLSMNDPQKILGVIPISADYRPSYTTMPINKLIPSMVSSAILKTRCNNDKCYTILDKDFPSRLEEHQNIGNYPSKNELLMQLYGSPKNPQGLFDANQLATSYGKRKSKPYPGFNDLLKQIYSIISDETSGTAGKKTPKYQVRPVAEDTPEFRIIGGSAATGSGTPVSSRGRSAYE